LKISKVRKRQQKFKDYFNEFEDKFEKIENLINTNLIKLDLKDAEIENKIKESNDYIYN